MGPGESENHRHEYAAPSAVFSIRSVRGVKPDPQEVPEALAASGLEAESPATSTMNQRGADPFATAMDASALDG